MRRSLGIIVGLVVLSTLFLPTFVSAASRSSIGFVGGAGFPVGWWSDRWDAFPTGEINFRYEFSPGTGILLITGLGKSLFSGLSPAEVEQESRVRDLPAAFEKYATITKSYQEGAFQQVPIGAGFYRESLVGPFRGYGSASMLVHLWRVDRSQEFTRKVSLDVPEFAELEQEDNWWDSQNGSDIGWQISLGLLYPVEGMWHLDLSAAYHNIQIDKEHAAVTYWGYPARTWDEERFGDVRRNVDFLQVRFGIRYGR